jgi:hypothetical protein
MTATHPPKIKCEKGKIPPPNPVFAAAVAGAPNAGLDVFCWPNPPVFPNPGEKQQEITSRVHVSPEAPPSFIIIDHRHQSPSRWKKTLVLHETTNAPKNEKNKEINDKNVPVPVG